MSEVTQAAAPTITVDGVVYELSIFSPEVQNLVGIHRLWEQKAQEARLEAGRAESAVRELNRDLIEKLKREIPAPTEEAVAQEAPVEAAPAE